MNYLMRTLLTSYLLDHLADYYDKYHRDIDCVALARDAMVEVGLSADEVEFTDVVRLTDEVVAQAAIDYQERN